MQTLSVQWMVSLFEKLSQTPDIIINGFLNAGICQSINAGRPIFDDADLHDSQSSDNDESSVYFSSDEDRVT